MKRFLLALCLLSFATTLFAQSPAICNPRSFGAKGDGVTLDTVAVSKAIAACAAQGGGTVYLGPGRYVIGTVQLQSHIHLYLESGAALVGSHDIHDYLPSPPFGFGRHYGVDITGEGVLLGMLIAKNATDIVIDGQGEIDGQGDSFMSMKTSHGGNDYVASYTRNPAAFEAAMSTVEYGPIEPSSRPGTMLVFFHCSNVRFHGVTLRNAPNWTFELEDVEGAELSNFQILNDPKIPNNDGIDCMMCRYVSVSDCHIDTGDDDFAIVLSSHVNVSACALSSRSAAIRLESTKLSTFTGLSMDTNRGIAVFANGYPGQENLPTEDVTFSDIVIRTRLIPGGWWGKAEPIYIAVQPCVADAPCMTRVRNVVFNNIVAEAENGILLWGADRTAITGVEFNGLKLHLLSPKKDLADAIGGNLDLRWTSLQPKDGIVKSDIPALYARHVDGLRLRDVQVDWAADIPAYYSDGLRIEDFNDVTIDAYSGRQAQPASKSPGSTGSAGSTASAIALARGKGIAITNSRATEGTRTFLTLDQVADRRVFVNYDLSAAATPISPPTTRFKTQLGVPTAKPTTH